MVISDFKSESKERLFQSKSLGNVVKYKLN